MNETVFENALGVSTHINDNYWVSQALEPMQLGFTGYPGRLSFVGVGTLSGVAYAIGDKLSPATIEACEQLSFSIGCGPNVAVVVVNEVASVHWLRQLQTVAEIPQLAVQDDYGNLVQDINYMPIDSVHMLVSQRNAVVSCGGVLQPLPLPRRMVDEIEDALSQRVTVALATAQLVGDE